MDDVPPPTSITPTIIGECGNTLCPPYPTTTTTLRHRIGTPLGGDCDDDGVVPFPTRRRSSGASSNMLDTTAKFAEGLGAILGTPSSKAPTPYSNRTPRRSITDQQPQGNASFPHTDDGRPPSSTGASAMPTFPTMIEAEDDNVGEGVTTSHKLPPYTFRFAGCTRPLYEAQAINIPRIVDQVVPSLSATLKWEAVTARWLVRRGHFQGSDGTNTPSD
eukprot:GFYU01059292.1.p1 GENE.GFYU01059292.1~~GFYU01059292.1.p1  ORF type:complete len:218 (-),score=10.40 GFYU01059292.1:108-761(-)